MTTAKILGAAFALTVASACGGPGNQLPNYPMHKPALQSTALVLPSFPDGRSVSLAEHRGKVVLVDVWATWCKPCRASMPALQAFARSYADKGLAVVTVNVDDEDNPIPAFVRSLNLTLPVWRDPGGRSVAKRLRFTRAPTSYLLDRNGVVRAVHVGYNSETLRKQKRQVDALLAE